MKKISLPIILLLVCGYVSAQSSNCKRQVDAVKKFAKQLETEKDYNLEFTVSNKIGDAPANIIDCELHKHNNFWWYKTPTMTTYQGDSLSMTFMHESEMIFMQKSVGGAVELDYTYLDSIVSVKGQVTCTQNEVIIKASEVYPVETTITLKQEKIASFKQEYLEGTDTVTEITVYSHISFKNEGKVIEDLKKYFFPNGEIREEYKTYKYNRL